jgi:hypothetical protein
MFFLGSVSGFLPYILAFSITLVWGSHAGLPFFKAGAIAESQNEISDEKIISADSIGSYSYDNQVVTENIDEIPSIYDTGIKVFKCYLLRLFDFAGIGISLLRAPPVSPF